MPTTQLYYPSNIPDTPGHHWSDAIAEATPIAHQGATAGAKVQALTMLDLILEKYRPEMRKYYFDPARYKTYMEQLGIVYPTIKP